jgi:hypothetical protein
LALGRPKVGKVNPETLKCPDEAVLAEPLELDWEELAKDGVKFKVLGSVNLYSAGGRLGGA